MFEKQINGVKHRLNVISLKRDIERKFPLPGVFGYGKTRNPAVMVVQDRPGGGWMQGFFRTKNGEILQKQLKQEGVDLEDVYVTAALKTRPGVKAQSVNYEHVVWAPELAREIQVIRPGRVIFSGREAMRMLNGVKHGVKGISSKTKGHRRVRAGA